MSKKKVISIDLNIWTTQTDKAANTIGKRGKHVTTEYISKLIRTGKLKSWKITELGLNLVER